MSTYEKIASVLLILLVAGVLVLWQGERNRDTALRGSDFDESAGQDFKLGPFVEVVSTQTSGDVENGCNILQPVIIAALHDIDVRLAAQAGALGIEGTWQTFEVNAATLGVLCNTQATIELSDTHGATLRVVKSPFVRAIPKGGTLADIGTRVLLQATVTSAGSSTPTQPQATAYMLIPDRFLE